MHIMHAAAIPHPVYSPSEPTPAMEPPPTPLPAPPSSELLGRVDDDVKEYLLSRGFTGTINAFEADRRDDRLKAFDVDKMLAQIDAFVSDPIEFTGAAVAQTQEVCRQVARVAERHPAAAAYSPGAIL